MSGVTKYQESYQSCSFSLKQLVKINFKEDHLSAYNIVADETRIRRTRALENQTQDSLFNKKERREEKRARVEAF